MKTSSKCIYIVCLLSVGFKSFSQCPATQPSCTLNTPLTPGDFKARDEVKAEPGCEMPVTGTDQIHLFIDPSIQLPATYQTAGTNGIPPVVRDVDYSFPVGTTPSSYQPSHDGSLNYTVPISIPPGTMAITPNLSVVYSSGGGAGFLGLGWNLSGISSINRAGKTLFHNGSIKEITLTNEDWFAFM